MSEIERYLEENELKHPKRRLFGFDKCYKTRKAAAIGSSGLDGLPLLCLFAPDENTEVEVYSLGKSIMKVG